DGAKICEYREPLGDDDPLIAGTFAPRLWENGVVYRNLRARLDENLEKTFPNAAFAEIDFVPAPESETPDGYPETLQIEDVPPFIYVARGMRTQPNSVGNELWQSVPRRPGCAIRRVDLNDDEAPVETIFEDPNGEIFDMNLSFDARTIFFSYRPEGNVFWNIYKIGVDGSGLTRLTSGPFFDVSPVESPDGAIIFVSTRRFGRTVCQPGPASNLFRMNPDGSDIHCVSMNTLSDFTPQILPDGRVIFTRWEYVDRDLTYRQSLWTQNPEGTLYQLYYGNTIRDFGSVLQARPIPGAPSSRVLATFAPHHGFPHGAIGVVDRSRGVEAGEGEGFVYWTREFPNIQDISREYAYRDPFPLDDDRALCAFGGGDGVAPGLRYRIWALDYDGQKRLLWEEPELDCFCPIALVETPRPPVLPTRVGDPGLKIRFRPNLTARELAPEPRVTDGVEAGGAQNVAIDADDDWGIPERQNLLEGDPAAKVVVADVYQGLAPFVERGAVKKLRIMEQIRKTEELRDRAFDQSPSMGVATYYAKRCWGEVPVEEDGSANFYAPALREIYFQALDAEGRE
ncbi:MAG: PD40 domain-containing protein, partial [Thermoguttaceae bacterium]|nr:PD40 domain-containing protein [Thermoguttaceae bacterium]